MKWTAQDIPDLDGKVVLVTGANSGLGYESALAMARKGAHVLLACRSMAKGEQAQQEILRQVPGASLRLMSLNLASLRGIEAFAHEVCEDYSHLDILMNNAGVMAPPYSITEDGFELQFGVNHLGHYALTGSLIHLLNNTPGSRVVTVSSVAAFYGRIRFNDLQSKKFYERWIAYCQSKLSNVLFADELGRWLRKTGGQAISIVVHPGISKSNLIENQLEQNPPFLQKQLFRIFSLPRQSVEMGALPQLYAGAAPGLQGGVFIGPDSPFHFRGYPMEIRHPRKSGNLALAEQLWQVSHELTGVAYS